jgi:hypothetical protein
VDEYNITKHDGSHDQLTTATLLSRSLFHLRKSRRRLHFAYLHTARTYARSAKMAERLETWNLRIRSYRSKTSKRAHKLPRSCHLPRTTRSYLHLRNVSTSCTPLLPSWKAVPTRQHPQHKILVSGFVSTLVTLHALSFYSRPLPKPMVAELLSSILTFLQGTGIFLAIFIPLLPFLPCLIVINLIPNLIHHRRLPLPLIPE